MIWLHVSINFQQEPSKYIPNAQSMVHLNLTRAINCLKIGKFLCMICIKQKQLFLRIQQRAKCIRNILPGTSTPITINKTIIWLFLRTQQRAKYIRNFLTGTLTPFAIQKTIIDATATKNRCCIVSANSVKLSSQRVSAFHFHWLNTLHGQKKALGLCTNAQMTTLG